MNSVMVFGLGIAACSFCRIGITVLFKTPIHRAFVLQQCSSTIQIHVFKKSTRNTLKFQVRLINIIRMMNDRKEN